MTRWEMSFENLRFGPTGGPSPTSDGPDVLPGPVSVDGMVQSGNLISSNLLAATEFLFDEANRSFQPTESYSSIPLQPSAPRTLPMVPRILVRET